MGCSSFQATSLSYINPPFRPHILLIPRSFLGPFPLSSPICSISPSHPQLGHGQLQSVLCQKPLGVLSFISAIKNLFLNHTLNRSFSDIHSGSIEWITQFSENELIYLDNQWRAATLFEITKGGKYEPIYLLKEHMDTLIVSTSFFWIIR